LKTNINKSWNKILEKELKKDYFISLLKTTDYNYSKKKCFPEKNKIFSALNHCSYENLKVVILGQDPYHNVNQANGLSFSVNSNEKTPPSLKNIFVEINNDINTPIRTNSDLTDWANQGVLLLNSVLSVEKGKPGSHSKIGWEIFTDNIIQLISNNKSKIVFMLWGGYAKKKKKLIDLNKHLILKTGHPSPLSANRGYWFGNKHFSKCNSFLIRQGFSPIKW
jgi:uracil-DNA glycosylase|tara:strand:- start:2029 stop:2694 length:666 start_codon:yes stop_codon:yes gene_type:complete